MGKQVYNFHISFRVARDFIGARVCEFLLERGDLVFGLDNMSDAYDVRLKHHRLETLSSGRGSIFSGAIYRITPGFFLCVKK